MKKILVVIVIIIIFGIGLFFVFGLSEQKTTEEDKASTASTERTIVGYDGKVLAGNSSPFLEFNKKDYEKALVSGKIIFLDFYANWCPICRAEAPEIHAGFDSLTADQLIGFRVNFNDSDTDNDEKQLAKDFNVPYQHTKIILKNGQEVSRSVDQWDKEKFIKEVNAATANK